MCWAHSGFGYHERCSAEYRNHQQQHRWDDFEPRSRIHQPGITTRYDNPRQEVRPPGMFRRTGWRRWHRAGTGAELHDTGGDRHVSFTLPARMRVGCHRRVNRDLPLRRRCGWKVSWAGPRSLVWDLVHVSSTEAVLTLYLLRRQLLLLRDDSQRNGPSFQYRRVHPAVRWEQHRSMRRTRLHVGLQTRRLLRDNRPNDCDGQQPRFFPLCLANGRHP